MVPVGLTLDLPQQPSAPALAREGLSRHFGSALTGRQLEDAVLVVSELVTNAVLHGVAPIRLRAAVSDGVLRGEVVDDGAGFEYEARARGVDELSGRGLSIVASLARRWGIHEGSSHVWFEIDPTAETEPASGDLGEGARPPEIPLE
jgi:anti-sigma regulatory factor (Ser/Thr protein kinase)